MKLKFVLDHLHNKRLTNAVASLATMTATLALLFGSIYQDQQNIEKAQRYERQKAIVDETVERYKKEAENREAYYQQLFTTGYVSSSQDEEKQTVMYVTTEIYSSLNVRELPNSYCEVIGKLDRGSEVTVIADTSETYSSFVKIEYEDGEGYIHSDFISEIEPEPVPLADKTATVTEESTSGVVSNNITTEYSQESDLVLNSELGRINGPSGEETYYNRNMNKVVDNMHDMGIEGEYSVRDDGVKMLGEYILVAANLDVHPRGSLVETSLGTGIVADTGEFANNNPTQIDIAVTW